MGSKKKTEETPDTQLPAVHLDPIEERRTQVEQALATYPTLEAGYLTKKGTYFDLEIAEKSLEEDEELIVVTRPDNK